MSPAGCVRNTDHMHRRHAALEVLLVKQKTLLLCPTSSRWPAESKSIQASCHLAVCRSEDEVGALRQVAVDVPRTAPGVAFFHEPAVQKCLERILYIWGVRCPAWLGSPPCISAACMLLWIQPVVASQMLCSPCRHAAALPL